MALTKAGIVKSIEENNGFDALPIARAIFSQCEYFLTTDDKVLKRDILIKGMKIVDPFLFIKETDEL